MYNKVKRNTESSQHDREMKSAQGCPKALRDRQRQPTNTALCCGLRKRTNGCYYSKDQGQKSCNSNKKAKQPPYIKLVILAFASLPPTRP